MNTVDPLTKQFIELIIKDILNSNPSINYFNDIFYFKSEIKKIDSNGASILFYPGFSTSFVETDKGFLLNIKLKNRIANPNSILDYLNNEKNISNDYKEHIKNNLIGRSFKVTYSKKKYKIDDILFDRNPKNHYVKYNGNYINLIK